MGRLISLVNWFRHSQIRMVIAAMLSPAIAWAAVSTFDQIRATRVDVDNIRIDGNTISSTNTNGDIVLDPNGTGGVQFSDLTADRVPYLDANKELVTSDASSTKLTYLAAATANLCGISQACTLTNKSIDADQNTITNIENADIKTGAAIGVGKLAALTANRVVVTDSSGFISASSVSSTEAGYLSGATSSIQTQLDAKQARSTLTAKGSLYAATASGTVGERTIGTNGHVLTADSSESTGMKWAAPTGGTSYFVHVTSSATTAYANGPTTWAMATEVSDANNLWSSNTFTAPADGKYQFCASFAFNGIISNGQNVRISVRLITAGSTWMLAETTSGDVNTVNTQNWWVGNCITLYMSNTNTADFRIETNTSNNQTQRSASGYNWLTVQSVP